MFSRLMILLLFFVSFLYTNSYAEETNVRVLLKWYHQFEFAGFYAAQSQGYYRDLGLHVELVEGSEEYQRDAISLVSAGEFDFAITDNKLLDSILLGDSISVVAQIFQKNSTGLVTLDSAGITDIRDIRGKSIVIDNAQGKIAQYFLKARGIERGEYEVIQAVNPVRSLSEGKISGYFGYLPEIIYYLNENSIAHHVFRPDSYGWDFLGDTVITNSAYASSNRDVVIKFIEATRKGWDYAINNPNIIVNHILSLKTNRPNSLSAKMLQFEIPHVIDFLGYDFVEVGHIYKKRWNRLFHSLCSLDRPSCEKIDFNEFYFQKEVEYFPYFISVTVALIILALVFAAMIFRHIRIIKRAKFVDRSLSSEKEKRKRIELELEMSQQAVGLALEGSGIAIFDSTAPFSYLQTNEQFALQIGYDPQNFHETFEHWAENVHPDDVDSFKGAFRGLVNGSIDSFESEIRVKHQSGAWKWILCRCQVIEKDKNKRPYRILGVNLNINDLKRAVEFAEETKKSQLSLLGSLGHEVRTPLTSIIGYSELLGDKCDEEKKSSYVRSILDNARNLLRVISGVIDISNAKNGKLIMAERPFRVDFLGNQIKECMCVMAEQKRIALDIKIDKSVPEVLIGDYFRYKQIITNIISNSMKVGGSGDISIQFEHSNKKNNGELVLRIFDDRHHVDEDSIPLLFDANSFHHFGDESNYSKTGFGLSVTKQLIDVLGGNMIIQRGKDSGTEYIVHLSCKTEGGDELETHGVLSSGDRLISLNLPILVVDDDDSNAQLIQKILEKFGISSDIAQDGYDAIQMVEKKNYSLIVMDIHMPGIDGVETTKVIRSKGITAPIIALSAYNASEYFERAKLAGIDDFISKPISQNELFFSIVKFAKSP